jgi:GT2 family glycosyltransferase
MSASSTSSVSVVIPGHNCAHTLEACLDALAPLIASRQVCGITFVDDHSNDGSRQLAARYPVRVLTSPRRGAGAARNVGWRAAETEYVWFVDADCVAREDALHRLCSTMSNLNATAVGGSYANQNVGSLIADLIHEEMVMRHRAMGRDVTFAITANLLCRRAILEKLDGFDETLRLGQDLDFAYRLVSSGERLGFDSTSLVGHFHETKLLRYMIKQARQGYWRMHIYRRHPQRVTGDSYSGLLDYVQPPLAVAALGAPLAGLAFGNPASGCAVGALATLALVLCQLPLASSLVNSTERARYWMFVPFGAMRAVFRGAGMALGIASAVSAIATRHSPPHNSDGLEIDSGIVRR